MSCVGNFYFIFLTKTITSSELTYLHEISVYRIIYNNSLIAVITIIVFKESSVMSSWNNPNNAALAH